MPKRKRPQSDIRLRRALENLKQQRISQKALESASPVSRIVHRMQDPMKGRSLPTEQAEREAIREIETPLSQEEKAERRERLKKAAAKRILEKRRKKLKDRSPQN